MNDLVHFYKWQPEAVGDEWTIDLQFVTGPNWGNAGYCCAAIVGRADGPVDQIPHLRVHAWSDSPDEAQYWAWKRAAYYLKFRKVPPPSLIGMIEDANGAAVEVSKGLWVEPEFAR